jgi:type IV pilus modification protein PilV
VRESGGSLIEALVALLVFSVGALGIAALQVTTVLRVDDTKQRSLALWKTQELVERIRASRKAGLPDEQMSYYVNAVNNTSLAQLSAYGASGFSCSLEAPAHCAASISGSAGFCSVQEIAAFDVWSIFCDPVLGVNAYTQPIPNLDISGAVTLKGFDLALVPAVHGYELYIRWIARDAEQNEQFVVQRKRSVDVCGKELEVDVRLGVYCVRIQ